MKRNGNAECFKGNETIIGLIHHLLWLTWNPNNTEMPRKKTAQHDRMGTHLEDKGSYSSHDSTITLFTRYDFCQLLFDNFNNNVKGLCYYTNLEWSIKL